MKIEMIEHRSQHRIDLDGFSDARKIELIQDLAANTATWGQWRFTNKAIWINADAPDLVAVVKLLTDWQELRN